MKSEPAAELEDLYGDYPLDRAYDQMREPSGNVRPAYRALVETLAGLPPEELQRRKQSAELSFLAQGITFTVYGRDEGTGKIFPYDLLPRLVTSGEWDRIERGLSQRITALNLFPRDVTTQTFLPRTASSAAKPPATFMLLCMLRLATCLRLSTARCRSRKTGPVLVERAQQPPDPPVPLIDLQQNAAAAVTKGVFHGINAVFTGIKGVFLLNLHRGKE